MKAMNFYTANGWAGSNYDSKLSTKEIAAKVRAFAKKNFPEFKFSVRSDWSMYTDSMYIELKEGVCIPFVEGSRSAERGYMSTMSTVKGWENELTPEMFKVLDAVTTYASSFRYDDSDGMQDYYDTNFYLKIKVSDEYKVIEPKAKKSSVKAEKVEEAKEVEAVTVEGLEIVDYSEKAIAVFGETKAIKEQLKELGGRFNPSLNYNGEKRAGWIFSKKQADKVKELITPTELPALPEEIYIPELAEETGPFENIHLIETDNFNGVRYYDIEGAGIITSAKVRADIQPGDVFNVYTDGERKFRVTYDGVSVKSSLKKDLPGIIEFNDKIESGTLSASSHYTPLAEDMEFYEKKVKGKRYTVKDKPLTPGYYGVLDNLDNCIIECYPTKEEAAKEAEMLNTHIGENGRLRSII
nr:MAG TPA: DNA TOPOISOMERASE I [Caudoviricetes sp.]